jgi:amino acid transporter
MTALGDRLTSRMTGQSERRVWASTSYQTRLCIIISVGVVVSALGAYLAWTLMALEVLYIPATQSDMPRFFKRENKAKTPVGR